MSSTLIVVPCGAKKDTVRQPARRLYLGAHFHYTRRVAEQLAAGHDAEVAILSALHGLVGLDDELDPYDVKLGTTKVDERALAAVLWQLDRRYAGVRRIVALTPKAYTQLLDDATVYVPRVRLVAPLAGSRGIGEQRGRMARLRWDDLA